MHICFPHPVHRQSDRPIPWLHKPRWNASGVSYPRTKPFCVESTCAHWGTVCSFSNPGLFWVMHILILYVKMWFSLFSLYGSRCRWPVFCLIFLQDYVGAPCLRLEVMGCTRLECTDINECKINNGGCDQKCVNG